MVDKELIGIWRNELKPAISLLLLNTDYEEMGEQDKEEFERDFDEILDLALVGLERTKNRTETHACDSISRQAAIRWVKTECNPYGKPTLDFESGKRVMKHLEQMPPVQPERKKGHWTNDGSCPFCGFQPWYERDIHTLSFCPNCGADMREAKVKYGDEETLQGGLMSAT